jgi:hypothetical protein
MRKGKSSISPRGAGRPVPRGRLQDKTKGKGIGTANIRAVPQPDRNPRRLPKLSRGA